MKKSTITPQQIALVFGVAEPVEISRSHFELHLRGFDERVATAAARAVVCALRGQSRAEIARFAMRQIGWIGEQDGVQNAIDFEISNNSAIIAAADWAATAKLCEDSVRCTYQAAVEPAVAEAGSVALFVARTLREPATDMLRLSQHRCFALPCRRVQPDGAVGANIHFHRYGDGSYLAYDPGDSLSITFGGVGKAASARIGAGDSAESALKNLQTI